MAFGSASVDPTTAAWYGSISRWDERNEPALRALADGVHGHGALCLSQMTHMGRRGTSTLTKRRHRRVAPVDGVRRPRRRAAGGRVQRARPAVPRGGRRRRP
jgi:2,4-dienoyl-CoA reductase-like NADH-dependent reductase (Old Yellow Enzyme family)